MSVEELWDEVAVVLEKAETPAELLQIAVRILGGYMESHDTEAIVVTMANCEMSINIKLLKEITKH